MNRAVACLLAGPLLLANACAAPAQEVDQVVQSQQAAFRVRTIARGLEHPWGLAFLPDGRMLVTERPGRLRLVSLDGTLSEPLSGVPDVDARRQGGLLDVAVDPDFAANRLVYLTFAEPGPGGTNSTAAFRGVLSPDDSGLTGGQVIFSQVPKVASTAHFGSRLVFDDMGHLFVTMGERFDYQVREMAQTLDNDIGKIVRIFPDGSIPPDNPFVGQAGARAEIWSYGHRNVQAAAMNPASGELWAIEHGPLGGDELNIARAGNNYGWPLVSFGTNYDGTPVGTGEAHMDGAVDPINQWTPVIAPSGMTIYSGAAFPAWQGDLFVGGLRSTALVRLELDGDSVVAEERLLESLGARIRDVVEGPDGALYLLTDQSDGVILRVGPG